MFRVRQTEILSQQLAGFLSTHDAEDTTKTLKLEHLSAPVKVTTSAKSSRRRRRPRRFAGASGSNIRTTWF